MEKPHIPFTSKELIEMLQSTDREERAASARRIWTDWIHLDDKEILLSQGPILLKLLHKEENSRHAWHFMIALGTIQYKEAIPIIKDRLLNSNSENIRGFAADALSRYDQKYKDDELTKLLWKLAKTDDSLVVRVNSIRALGNQFIGSKEDDITMKLLSLLKTQKHSAIKSTIVGLVGEIGSLSAVPELTHIMITRRTEMDKKIAALALDQIAIVNGYKNRLDLIKKIKTANNIADSKESQDSID